jgi:hypothetical protein
MSDTTNVGGYFNGNTFPIQINISAIGQTYTLAPGEFITALDTRGQKVKLNDPLFEAYVGKMRLSKEILKDKQVNIYRVMSRDERGQVPVIQTAPIKTAGDGKLVTPTIPPPEPATGPNSPIKGMSIQQAIEMGLIPRPRISTEKAGVTETEGAPFRGESIPEIQYDDADVKNYKPRAKLDGSLLNEKVALNINSEKASIPLPPPPSSIPTPTLPDVVLPTLDDAKEQLESKEAQTFVCDLENPPKVFQFRSQLESYLRKKYPTQLESYMARYPKKK